jgi:hypothetical protein
MAEKYTKAQKKHMGEVFDEGTGFKSDFINSSKAKSKAIKKKMPSWYRTKTKPGSNNPENNDMSGATPGDR